MIEVILVYFLAKRMGNLAEQKGLSSRSWIWRTVLVWIVSEILGVLVAISIWGQDNLLMSYLTAIGFAIGGYFTLREVLHRKDDPPPTKFDFENEQKNTDNS